MMKKLETEAKKRGVKLSEAFGIEAQAPDGLHLNASGCHSIVVSGVMRTGEELQADLLEQIEQGFCVCDDEDCELCEEAGISIESRYMMMAYICPDNCKACVAYKNCTGGNDIYPPGYRVYEACLYQIHGTLQPLQPCNDCSHNPCKCVS